MKNRADWVKGLGLLTWIASELVALTLLGGGLGYGLHVYWGWSRLGMVFLGLAGFSLAILRVYRGSLRMQKSLQNRDQKDNEIERERKLD